MPELPELEVVREVLQRRVVGQTVTDVQVIPPGGLIVVRDATGGGLAAALVGQSLSNVLRRGKFLSFRFEGHKPTLHLLVNPKLTGRLQLAEAGAKRLPKTAVIFGLSGGGELRYADQKQMGQLYMVEDPRQVPEYSTLGPEALEVSEEDFRARLKPFRGEIKGILTRGQFVAGIGNAYSDEILWTAQLHPFRKRTQLTIEEVGRLYQGMRSTLLDAIERVRILMGEDIHLEPRQFMAVHMKTGEPCPRCGAPISLISANQTITNFCRRCQPGGLIKGMEQS
jgi:formamidopyrimidine-DNA glycosylase